MMREHAVPDCLRCGEIIRELEAELADLMKDDAIIALMGARKDISRLSEFLVAAEARAEKAEAMLRESEDVGALLVEREELKDALKNAGWRLVESQDARGKAEARVAELEESNRLIRDEWRAEKAIAREREAAKEEQGNLDVDREREAE